MHVTLKADVNMVIDDFVKLLRTVSFKYPSYSVIRRTVFFFEKNRFFCGKFMPKLGCVL